MLEAIDCMTPLTAETVAKLKQTSYRAVGRYLGAKYIGLAKGITPIEKDLILSAGLSLFLIYETMPTQASYFTQEKGIHDAKTAIDEAEFLGVPKGTAIYFTVDFDAQAGDMPAVIAYFKGIRSAMGSKYLVGAYGGYAVMEALYAQHGLVDKFYQTYAWSDGKAFTDRNIYQYRNSVEVAGIAVDLDMVSDNAGLWVKPKVAEVR